MAEAERRASPNYDGSDADALRAATGVPRVDLYDDVGSTLDAAHEAAAAGAPGGTLVLADRQTAGRGRGGKRWASHSGAGVWLTLLERPRETSALDVMSLRLGLRAAPVLERWSSSPVRLKWPNDLYVGAGKLAGVLVEARWREERVEWVAVGVGINVVAPADVPGAAQLAPGADRVRILAELVPALRAAAFASGPLSDAELAAYAARDMARGRRCVTPAVGTVRGVDAGGALLVERDDGVLVAARSGSLVFAEEGS